MSSIAVTTEQDAACVGPVRRLTRRGVTLLAGAAAMAAIALFPLLAPEARAETQVSGDEPASIEAEILDAVVVVRAQTNEAAGA